MKMSRISRKALGYARRRDHKNYSYKKSTNYKINSNNNKLSNANNKNNNSTNSNANPSILFLVFVIFAIVISLLLKN